MEIRAPCLVGRVSQKISYVSEALPLIESFIASCFVSCSKQTISSVLDAMPGSQKQT